MEPKKEEKKDSRKDKKFDRASRTGYRGDSKKEGAGGKFTWGKLGSEIEALNDPMDFDEDEKIQAAFSQVMSKAENAPPRETSIQIIHEYFSSEDVDEVSRSILENNIFPYYDFIKLSVVESLEHNDRERELVSRLISFLYSTVFPPRHIIEAFRILIHRIDDLALDSPDAATLLAKFIARGIGDEVLPPSFTKRTQASTPLGESVLRSAAKLWESKDPPAELIWGDPLQSVSALKQRVREIVKEFIVSADVEEAVRSIRTLAVPSFFLAIVKIAVEIAIENEKCKEIVNFFKRLLNDILTERQLCTGLSVAISSIGDLAMDISPHADRLLQEILQLCFDAKLVHEEFFNKAKNDITANLARDEKQREQARQILQQ